MSTDFLFAVEIYRLSVTASPFIMIVIRRASRQRQKAAAMQFSAAHAHVDGIAIILRKILSAAAPALKALPPPSPSTVIFISESGKKMASRE